MTNFVLLLAVIFVTLCPSLNAFEKKNNRRWFVKGRLRDGGFLGHLGRSNLFRARKDHEIEHWFRQRLDHFQPADDREWSQRYYVNSDNYHHGK